MKCIRFGYVVLTACLSSGGLQAAPELTRLVPASAPVVLHVRNIGQLRAGWAASTHAKAWQDPEIRKFFAPALDALGEGEGGLVASLKKDTGMTPEEFFDLFTGEAIFAVKDFAPYFRGEVEDNPQMLFAIECSGAAAKIQEIIARNNASEKKDGSDETEEEFQGETMHVTVKTDDSGGRAERQAWAIVDGVFLVGEPKSVLQEAIVAVKKGGVEDPIAQHPALANLYRKSPDTQALMHVGLDGIISPLVAMLESTAGQTDANGNPTGPAAQLAQVGLTPTGLVHTLGLDALKSLDLSLAFRERETVLEGDLSWSEKRGLLRMAAVGEPPVPMPDFMPDSWLFAGVDNFSVREAYTALMQTLGELSPMLDGLVRQQMKNANTQMGIDLERDLFGSFGDVMISGYALPAGGATADQPFDQFIGIALSNPDAFRGALDAIIGRTPLGQMSQNREYLGETIRDFSLPNGKSLALSVTRGYLLVGVGGPAMVESAIQGLQGGAARPFWKKSEVVKALHALPDGASSILVADVGRMASLVVDFLAEKAVQAKAAQANTEAESEGEGEEAAPKIPILVDPSARPSPETIAKYWSTMVRGIYSGPNGFHLILKLDNGR